MKKICIIYANCQNRLLAECLSKSTLFNQEYLIKRFPAHLLIQGKKTIPEQILKKAKLFIYQPVKEVHGKASSEYILSQLSPDCQTISFPSLYFTGYFPQHYKKPNKRIVKSIYPFGIIPEGDLNVANMLEQGQNPNQIIEQLQHQDFYTSEFLRANVDSSLAELARRESSLDIKVSQFIRDNYQQQRLFYVHNHPTDILGFYITNLILNKINLPQFDTQDLAANPAAGILDNTQVPIYPSVIKHLQLSFTQNITYKHNRFCTNNLTFERYIQEYINLDQLVTGSSGGFYFAGIKHLAKNKYSLAEKSLKEAIKINPQNAAYYRELGKVYEQQQQLDRAELVYKKAISISP
ncbi:MAG: WcbI family polysaccharide biosynthesis putative acetyltransferase, partial [Cyanobacteria bacterium J06600_6]